MFRRLAGTRSVTPQEFSRPAALFLALVLSLAASSMQAQSNQWTWQGGSAVNPATCSYANNYCAQPGVYGTQGTPAADNIPSSRDAAATAVDSQGNFWLFGGSSLNDLWRFDFSLQQWVWLNGSNTGTAPAVWGQLGVPAAANIPSARHNAVSWIDSSGNFWLFGGEGLDSAGNYGLLNDLWKYNPSTNQWVWMAGSNLFTCSYNSDYFKTICVQPATNGTLGTPEVGNTPGGRIGAVPWTDGSGNLWLFGGQSYDSLGTGGLFNDYWKFSPSLNQWAWMGGAGTIDCINMPGQGFCVGSDSPQPVYGTLGVPDASNTPGGRTNASGWTDSHGDLWIFGGTGNIVTGPLTEYPAYFNDLWKFNPATNQWTWMSGTQSTPTSAQSFSGVYGTLGVPAAANNAGSRINATSWTDNSGNLWLFGGWGYDATNTGGYLNDVWMFNPSINKWTWMNGNTTIGTFCPWGYCGQPPNYGTLGAAAPGNNPGARAEAASWADHNGNLWFFGAGIDPMGIFYNDFWEYQPSATNLPPAILPAFSPPAGTYTTAQSVTISNGMANASIYYTTNGSTPTSGSTLYTGPVSVSASETVQALAVASGYPNSGVAMAAYAITPPAAMPAFSLPAGLYYGTQSVTISDTTSGATIYYTTDGSTPTTSSTLYSGSISVANSETIQAIATAAGHALSPVASAVYTIGPPPDFSVTGPPTLTVQHGQSVSGTVSVTPVDGFSSLVSFACSGLPAGASCAFSPSTVTPSGGTASTTITISTSSTVASVQSSHFWVPQLALVLSCFGCGCSRSTRSRRRIRPLFLASLSILVLLAGCGGGGSSFKSFSSTVTVTASSGSVQHSTTVVLSIN